jgi:HlyD family secretion protein
MDARANASVISTARKATRKRHGAGLAIAGGAVIVATLGWMAFVPDPIPVETALAVRGPMQVTVENQGRVRAHDRYIIAAPVAAELERIDLNDGEKVVSGQVLAVLRPLPLDARQRDEAIAREQAARALLEEAKRRSRRAEAEFQLAVAERHRVRLLVKDHFMSAQAADRAVVAEQAAQAESEASRSHEQAVAADVRAAQAALVAVKTADNPASRLELSSPVNGYAVKVHEKSRRTIAAGSPLVTVADPSRYEVVVDVLSTDAVRVRPGQRMLLDNWGGAKPLPARVRLVEPVAFTKVSALGVEEQRVNIIADPAEPLGALGDGYRVEARIVVWEDDNTLKVPGSSLFRSGVEWHVFVIEGGRVRARRLEIGQRNQDEAQVLAGLEAGTALVRFPSNDLKDGVRVQALGSR